MADNSQSKTENLPDNALNNHNCTVDNTPKNELVSADNIQQNTAKGENFLKISILELQKKYGIGREPVYIWMRYLGITTWKVSGKAYLDAQQVELMDALHDHIKVTGRMDGYPVPEPTGPKSEEEGQPTTAITVTQISIPTQQNTVDSEQLNAIECRLEGNSELDPIASLVHSAQNKAVGVLIAENMLAEQFIKNPDSLPQELRTKINFIVSNHPNLILEVEGADHCRYFDITLLILLAGVAFVIMRFIGLGTNDQALYIFGGIAAAIFLELSRIL